MSLNQTFAIELSFFLILLSGFLLGGLFKDTQKETTLSNVIIFIVTIAIIIIQIWNLEVMLKSLVIV